MTEERLKAKQASTSPQQNPLLVSRRRVKVNEWGGSAIATGSVHPVERVQEMPQQHLSWATAHTVKPHLPRTSPGQQELKEGNNRGEGTALADTTITYKLPIYPLSKAFTVLILRKEVPQRFQMPLLNNSTHLTPCLFVSMQQTWYLPTLVPEIQLSSRTSNVSKSSPSLDVRHSASPNKDSPGN